MFPAGQTFVLANMIEQGPARQYLQEVCPGAGFKLCASSNTLPASSYEFLWSTDNLERLGGFEGMHDEAAAIVAGTIRTHPAEVLKMMAHSIASSFLVHSPGAELFPLSNDPWMTDVLVKKFGPETLRSYKTSLAARDLIPREYLRVLDEVTFPAAVLALLIAGFCAFRRHLTEAFVAWNFRCGRRGDQQCSVRLGIWRARPLSSESDMARGVFRLVDIRQPAPPNSDRCRRFARQRCDFTGHRPVCRH